MLSCFSHVRLFVTPMVCSPPGSSVHGILQTRILELPFPSPGDLPNLRIEPASLMSPALAGGFFTSSTTWEAIYIYICYRISINLYFFPITFSFGHAAWAVAGQRLDLCPLRWKCRDLTTELPEKSL